MSLIRICIIVPTHNRKVLLKQLLSQTNQQIKEQKKAMIDVVAVVDGSTDGTLEMLAQDFPDVHVVHGDGSWWYTKSMNEGFRYAIEKLKPEYVLTLNDDVLLADNYIQEVFSSIEKGDGNTIIGSVGITNERPYRIVTSGNSIRNKWLGLYNQHIPFLSKVNLNDLSEIHPSITLPGRGMLIPIKVLKELNAFDAKFKQYHSDGDFTLRAIKKGYKINISWDAKIFVSLKKTSTSTSFMNKSIWVLIKSFFNKTSRNYLPDKIRFHWRHSNKACLPLLIIMFLFISFRNLVTKTKI